jgi:hypothetical protein
MEPDMANLSDYSENLLLKFHLTAEAVTRPAAWYVGVGTGHSDTGLSGEPSGNGYARQAATFTVTGDTAENDALLTFGPNTGTNWGTMASVAIFDAATSGNCLWSGALTDSRAIAVGDSLTIAAGALTATLA